MSSPWTTRPFGEVYKVPSKNGVNVPKSRRGQGLPLMNMAELFRNETILEARDWELVPVTNAEEERFGLSRGDLLFGRRSLVAEGAGKVSLYDCDDAAVFDSSLIRVRPDATLADPRYLLHYFRSPQGRSNIRQIKMDDAVSGIRSSDLATLEVPLPSLHEQQRIAGVLGAFDDLIETNRRLAASLESLAFLTVTLAAKDAPSVPFEDLAIRVIDRVLPARMDGHGTYLGLEHFAVDGAGLIGHGSTDGVTSSSLQFRVGDVLYGKLRPYFRKVARPGFEGVCSAEIWVLRVRNGHSQAVLHAVAHSPQFSAVAMAGNSGTKMPRADWDHIANFESPDLRETLTEGQVVALDSLWEAACSLRQESDDLARQRDQLLPLLMSGKVRVADVEGVA